MSPSSEPSLIVIGGPTGVGKTALSIKLAQFFDTQIVSCDSRQIYKELRIGVARPTDEELQAVPHHFIASHSIQADYNAAIYAREARQLLLQLFQQHNAVVMTGGTGLFVKAVVDGFDPLPEPDPGRRAQLNQLLEERGLDHLASLVLALDPESRVDLKNPQRVIRAIEILERKGPALAAEPLPPFKSLLYYLDMDRDELYARIDRRVDQMFAEGLVDEARSLYAQRELNALRTVGYSELFRHFAGDWNLEQSREKIKQHSRNYAKRQLTWFRNKGYTRLPASYADAVAVILSDLG